MRPRWPNPSEDPGVFLASWKCPNRGVESREPGRSTLAHKEGLIGRRFDGKDTPPRRLFHAGWRAVSVRAFGWAWEQRGLDPVSRCVLLFLAESHNRKTGLVCPALNTIAEHVEVSLYAVKRALSVLTDNGLIQVEHRARAKGEGRGRASNRYILACDLKPESALRSFDLKLNDARPNVEADATASENAPRTGKTLEPVPNGTDAAGKTDPRIGQLVGEYVLAHKAHHGARPRDVGRMGTEIVQALADGWTIEAIQAKVPLAASDPFGAASLVKHLRNGNGSSALDQAWAEVEHAVAAGKGRASLSSPRGQAAWLQAFGAVDGRYVDLDRRAFTRAWHEIGVIQRRRA